MRDEGVNDNEALVQGPITGDAISNFLCKPYVDPSMNSQQRQKNIKAINKKENYAMANRIVLLGSSSSQFKEGTTEQLLNAGFATGEIHDMLQN